MKATKRYLLHEFHDDESWLPVRHHSVQLNDERGLNGPVTDQEAARNQISLMCPYIELLHDTRFHQESQPLSATSRVRDSLYGTLAERHSAHRSDVLTEPAHNLNVHTIVVQTEISCIPCRMFRAQVLRLARGLLASVPIRRPRRRPAG